MKKLRKVAEGSYVGNGKTITIPIPVKWDVLIIKKEKEDPIDD